MVSFQITMPDRDECMVGIMSSPNVIITYSDNDDNKHEEIKNMFSIGLLLIRLDIFF